MRKVCVKVRAGAKKAGKLLAKWTGLSKLAGAMRERRAMRRMQGAINNVTPVHQIVGKSGMKNEKVVRTALPELETEYVSGVGPSGYGC